MRWAAMLGFAGDMAQPEPPVGKRFWSPPDFLFWDSTHFFSGGSYGRRPRLLFRFVGWFALRYADRHLAAVLLKLPPRFTRFGPRYEAFPPDNSTNLKLGATLFHRFISESSLPR